MQITSVSEDILVSTARIARERWDHTDQAIDRRIHDTRHARDLLQEQQTQVSL